MFSFISKEFDSMCMILFLIIVPARFEILFKDYYFFTKSQIRSYFFNFPSFFGNLKKLCSLFKKT